MSSISKNNWFVVIVTYNAEKWLSTCLSPFLGDGKLNRVIIVDNASKDDTVEIINKKYIGIKVILNKKNIGFGQANNKGIQYALEKGAHHILLLNQDARLEVDELEALVCMQQMHTNFGVLSPLHWYDENKLDLRFGNYIDKYSEWSSREILVKRNYLPDILETDFVNAAIWMVSRDCLEKVGGFDPLFFHYGEDNDYIYRVRFHGWKVGICPGIDGFHLREQNIIQEVNSKEQLKKIQRKHLLRLKDLNTSFWINFRRSIMLTLKQSLYFLKNSQINESLNGLKFFFKLFWIAPFAYKSYRNSKFRSQPWLNKKKL